jgi:uroporphyrinogen decarboxylase
MPNRQPNFDRFLQVVRRQGEPDRVPFSEFGMDHGILAALVGPPAGDAPEQYFAWLARAWAELGYDYVTGATSVSFPHASRIAEDTAEMSHGTRGWVEEAKGPITTWEEFEAYPWPEVTPESYRNLEAMGRALPDGMKVVANIPGGPLENLTFIMGFEAFSYALLDQPDLVAAIAQRIDAVLCQVVEVTAQMEWVGAQWVNDDMGFKGGTLASPETLREHVFPTQKRLCEITHAQGKPVLMHSCGRLHDIMDELIDDVGIDAKHSFEDVIQPVWEAKAQWGDRVALLGGVDMDVLARGSEDEVRAYTRRCLETCAPGGGWALGSGNTIANYIPVRNYRAMLEEGWERGRYGA